MNRVHLIDWTHGQAGNKPQLELIECKIIRHTLRIRNNPYKPIIAIETPLQKTPHANLVLVICRYLYLKAVMLSD